MSYILAFDVTNENLSISLANQNKNKDESKDKIIDTFIHPRKFSPTETIMNSLEFFFVKNNLKFEQIDSFLVVNGPASFIRIRIAMTIAKALSFVLSKAKFYTINIFEIYNFLIKEKNFINKNQLIVLYGYGNIFYIEYLNSQQAIKSEEILKLIEDNQIENIFCDEKSAKILSNLISKNSTLLHNFETNMECFSKLAINVFLKNSKERAKESLEPFYLMTPTFRKII